MARTSTEGKVPFKGHSTWYRRTGKCEPGKYPLLLLHGGPGACHNYLESMEDIADFGREVIFYDQLGCGNSTIPSNPDLWSAKLFEEEIDVMRKALGLEKVHILGQSWGGMLLMQYAISRPKGIISMVVASSPASMDLWLSEANRLIDWLPPEMAGALKKADASGDYTSPDYKAAYAEYYRRHVCNLDPYPDFVSASFDNMGEPYYVMQGNSEFVVTGKLKGWDVTGDLHKITIPTLLTSGVMDEATPLIVKTIYDRIPDCEWALIMGTHLVHVEQRDEYNRIVEEFLSRKEKELS
ncbi:proline iminopeptidase [Spirochaetia bacterium]|nr:proline iminopeptidase [Spirochaetia bacterium]